MQCVLPMVGKWDRGEGVGIRVGIGVGEHCSRVGEWERLFYGAMGASIGVHGSENTCVKSYILYIK